MTDVENVMIRGSIASAQKAIRVVKDIIYYLERREDRGLRKKVYDLMGKHRNDKKVLIEKLEKEKGKILKKSGDLFVNEEEKNVIRSTKETVDNVFRKREKEKEIQDNTKDIKKTIETYPNRRSMDDVLKEVDKEMKKRREKNTSKVMDKTIKRSIRFTKP